MAFGVLEGGRRGRLGMDGRVGIDGSAGGTGGMRFGGVCKPRVLFARPAHIVASFSAAMNHAAHEICGRLHAIYLPGGAVVGPARGATAGSGSGAGAMDGAKAGAICGMDGARAGAICGMDGARAGAIPSSIDAAISADGAIAGACASGASGEVPRIACACDNDNAFAFPPGATTTTTGSVGNVTPAKQHKSSVLGLYAFLVIM